MRLKRPNQIWLPHVQPSRRSTGARHASGAKATNNWAARKNVFARYDHEGFIAAAGTSTSTRFSKHRALAALPPMARVPATYPAATQSVAVDARRPLALIAASAVLTAFPPRAPDAANPLDIVVGGVARRHARDADADVDTDARDADRAVANADDAIVVIVADAAHVATLRIAMDDGECRRARSSRRNGALRATLP